LTNKKDSATLLFTMVEAFSIDFLAGVVFGMTAYFAALGCWAMFKAFKLPADVG
jgi:hypothetical protein